MLTLKYHDRAHNGERLKRVVLIISKTTESLFVYTPEDLLKELRKLMAGVVGKKHAITFLKYSDDAVIGEALKKLWGWSSVRFSACMIFF